MYKIFILTACFMIAFMGSVSAKSLNDENISLKYNVYAGGLHALKASLDMSLTAKKYDIEVDAKTNGFIGKVFPWAGHFETVGTTDKKDLIPETHTSTSSWKKKAKEKELEYKDGVFKAKHEIKNGKKTTNNKIKNELTIDTVDMLTGAVQLLQNAENQSTCNGSVPVFDGKRRFNLIFKEAGSSTIRKSKYSAFSGTALKCTVEIEPVLGFRAKDKKRGWLAVQNHTKARKKMPTIWLSKLEEDGPVVPVRVEIASSYGAVIAHLTSIKSK